MAQFLWNAWALHLFFTAAVMLLLWESVSEFVPDRSLPILSPPVFYALFVLLAAAASVRGLSPEASRAALSGILIASALHFSSRKVSDEGVTLLLKVLGVSSAIFGLLFLLAHLSSPSVDELGGIALYLNHNVAVTWILFGLAAGAELLTVWKWPSRIILAIGATAFFVTGSRAGMGGLMIGALYYFSGRVNVPGRRAGLFAAAVLGTAGAAWLFWNGPSAADRWRWWKAAAEIAGQHPLLGAGPGAYERLGAEFSGSGLKSLYAHNFYLQTAAELGIPAAACLAFFLFSFARAPRRRAVAAGLAAVLFQNLFDYSLHLPGIFAVFLVLLAWCAPLEPRTVKARIPKAASAVALLALALAAGSSAWSFGIKPLAAIGESMNAQDAFDRKDLASAEDALRKAAAWDPWTVKYRADLAMTLALDFRIHPEKRELIQEAVKIQTEAVRREPGNRGYRLQQEEILRMAETHAP
jgi:hypothetical protein